MKNSHLRKTSPEFQEGYRAGCTETLRAKTHTIKTSDDDNTKITWAGYVESMKDHKPEAYLAGDLEGYRRGYSHGRDVEKNSGVSGVAVGLVVLVAAAGGFLIAAAL